MRSLVTGANGLIGGYLAEQLLSDGHAVCAMVRKPGGHVDSLPGDCRAVYGDVADAGFVAAAVKDFRPDTIYHLAAQSLPGLSWKDPVTTYRANLEGTHNVFSSVVEAGLESKVVMACSSAEYAQVADGRPIAESAPLDPGSIYGVTKVANYHLARLFHRAKGLRVVCVRPFFLIGPRKTGDVSSDLARGIVRIERGQARVVRHGNLDAVRDFLDVRDGVSALIVVADQGEPGEVYNICSGGGLKISALLEKFRELVACDIESEVDPARFRPVDEPVRVGDPSRLKALGWSPRYSIDGTVRDILEYWRQNEPHD